MWIESHQEIAQHPKTRRLARRLGVSVPAVIGHLHLLWWWSVDYADDGNLAKYMPEDIADAMMWEGDPQVLWDALVEIHWIDVREDATEIHDWSIYIGRLLEKRRKDAERKRDSRDKTPPVPPPSNGHPPDVLQDVHRTAQVTVPNLTVPRDGPPAEAPRKISLPTRNAQVIDAIRALCIHPEPSLDARDHAAIKASNALPGLIAEVYGAVYRGEYGDQFMQKQLSVRAAIGWINGYQSFKANGPPRVDRNGHSEKPRRIIDHTGVANA